MNCVACLNSKHCSACAPGYFGINCTESPKSESCDSCTKNSQCSSNYEYSGVTCIKCRDNCIKCKNSNYCDTCESGFYGSECTKCPEHCIDCRSSTNCSRCDFGWYGDKCNIKCNCYLGCYADGTCQPTSFLFYTRLPKCDYGWRGLSCQCNRSMAYCKFCDSLDPCEECKTGWYGDLCEKKCSNSCNTSLGCLKKSGNCLRESCNDTDGLHSSSDGIIFKVNRQSR